ncbi:MAG: hypothetical protein KYX69_09260 [Sphingomonas sp.]|uniref:hypothetical protein n=1 Tax=Sphingomonas sp. TaxID=28214 RepID=UPI0026376DE0|nr:hypothetical protein [Sphingomonas sp.]MDK2767893.1 hypothetical protein [Sphingomonas sp.]
MNDVLPDVYNEANLSGPMRLMRLRDALTAMRDTMTDLSKRAAAIAAEFNAGVHTPAKAAALLKEVTSQQRKLTAKVAMVERIIASFDEDISG